tara:strand:- start:5816 stop:6016 length:201 start_codon:yes stop_codon:yes gene_type:complete
MINKYITALKLQYIAEIAIIEANLSTYFENSVGVAEHPNISKDIDDLVGSLATAQEKLNTIEGIKL